MKHRREVVAVHFTGDGKHIVPVEEAYASDVCLFKKVYSCCVSDEVTLRSEFIIFYVITNSG